MIKDDTSQIIPIMNVLRKNFETQITKDIKFRKQQLINLKQGLIDMDQEFTLALKKDLNCEAKIADVFHNRITIKEVQYLIENIDKLAKKRSIDTSLVCGPAVSYVLPEPLGLALIMSSWNFPTYTAIPPLACAIAAGNVAILKPSELAPVCSNLIRKLFQKYLNPKCYQVIEGQIEVAKNITQQKFDLIFFTGSTEKGKMIAQACAKYLTPCVLELGGKSPAIVDKDADIENASLRITQSKFVNCGQVCLATDHVFVHEDIKEKFVQKIQEKIVQFYGKNPQESKDYSSIITNFHLDRLSQMIKENHKGKQICQYGETDYSTRYFPPTLIENPSFTSKMMTEEIFGPIMPIFSFKDIQEPIRKINQGGKPLAIYYYGKNTGPNVDKMINETSSGAICINESAFHVLTELPFGGVGDSGMGKYHGPSGFDVCSHLKSVHNKMALNLYPLSCRFPPHTQSKHAMLCFLLDWADINQSTIVKFLIFLVLMIVAVMQFFNSSVANNQQIMEL